MDILLKRRLGDGRVAHVACTDKSDGDLSISTTSPVDLLRRRSALVDMPWSVSRQVHSDRVVHPDPTATNEPPIADATVTALSDRVVAAHSADCVPIGLIHAEGAVAVAHAGWKGLERGVLESTVRALKAHGAGSVEAVVGPHIRVASYEFGIDDLTRLQKRFGVGVAGQTSTGTPGLDLTAAVRHELTRLGVDTVVAVPQCTAVDEARFWSYRARQESGRFALLAWMSNER